LPVFAAASSEDLEDYNLQQTNCGYLGKRMAIARVALPVAHPSPFDYWVPAGLTVERGSLVRVRLARRAMVGVVVNISTKTEVSKERLQPISEIVHEVPALQADLLELGQFIADYYQEPLGRVLAQMVPPLGALRDAPTGPSALVPSAQRLTDAGRDALARELGRAPRARALYEQWAAAPDGVLPAAVLAALPARLKERVRRWREAHFVEDARPAPSPAGADAASRFPLNNEQRRAVAAIVGARGGFAPFLLDGVTGSGKTEVYLAASAAFIAAGMQALLLVPEITLTPQFLARIADALPGGRTITLHSRLASGLRRREWRAAAVV
jgi:primosomal protein N' (replication factor Y) (superfamily II helicase)